MPRTLDFILSTMGRHWRLYPKAVWKALGEQKWKLWDPCAQSTDMDMCDMASWGLPYTVHMVIPGSYFGH